MNLRVSGRKRLATPKCLTEHEDSCRLHFVPGMRLHFQHSSSIMILQYGKTRDGLVVL